MESLLEQLKKFQKIYDEMLGDENWANSPFLKIMHAKLTKLKFELDEVLNFDQPFETLDISPNQKGHFQENNFEKFYIYLYTTEGKKLDAWQRLVDNLERQYISRPIYCNEKDVQYAVFNAPVFHNAGYVAVWVEKKFIQIQDELIKDKFGNDLMVLKDRAISLDKIDYFWTNSTQYKWKDGKLVFFQSLARL
jgi:intracellular multiplication protein IcmQ